jgi:glutamate carboxypeptidase
VSQAEDDVLLRALAACDRRADQALALLRAWVEINSYSGNLVGCNRMADELEQAFAAIGLQARRRVDEGIADQVWLASASWDGIAADRRVVLVGHHDTVFPPGTSADWRVDGDRAFGPGVLDMKGGLVVIWTALAALSEVGKLELLPLSVVSVSDEEIGSPRSATFTARVARGAAAALVFEAGRHNDAIVIARKGTGKVTVRALGRAAHAGNDLAAGANAVWAIARFIDVASALTGSQPGLTVNVGVVGGGTSANTVPAAAHCELDFRFVREADGAWLLEQLAAAAAAAGLHTGTTLTIEGGIRRPALEPTATSRALMAAYLQAAVSEGLGGGEAPLAGGGSDANNLAAVGVPVIDGLGPRGRFFHTHDEYIEVPTVRLRARALVRWLLAHSLARAT